MQVTSQRPPQTCGSLLCGTPNVGAAPRGHDGWRVAAYLQTLLSAGHDRAGGQGEAMRPSMRLCRWYPTMAETVSLAFHSPDSRSQVAARSLTAGLLSAPRVHIFCPRLPELQIHNLDHQPQRVLLGPNAQDSPLGVLPSWGSCQQDFVSWLGAGAGAEAYTFITLALVLLHQGPANRSRHSVGALLWPRVQGNVQSLSHRRGQGPYQAGVPQVHCKFKGDSSTSVPWGCPSQQQRASPQGQDQTLRETVGPRGATLLWEQSCGPSGEPGPRPD